MKTRIKVLASMAAAVALCGPNAIAQQAPADPPAVDPEVVAALKRMGAYLDTIKTARVVADTSIDEVLDNGQKVLVTGKVTYQLRRPDGFVIEVASDRRVRQFFYDGKTFTVYAPRTKLYAQVEAPATVTDTLDMAEERYGIMVPLRDLFTWNNQSLDRAQFLNSAMHVGYAKVNGLDTDQYALRETGVDWQVWIQRGDRPLPVKVVITSTLEPTQPQYITNLTWSINPRLSASTFAFSKPSGSMPIAIVAANQ